MERINEKFNEYMAQVKKMDINTKRRELYDSLRGLAEGIIKMAEADGVELHYLVNREIEDLSKENLNEDDYIEGMLVYFETVKNMIGEYLIAISNK